MGLRKIHQWDEPTSVEIDRAPAGVLGGWTACVELTGQWAHCVAGVEGVVAYAGRPWRLLGKLGGLWAILQAGVINVPALYAPNAGELSGIISRIRGTPCDGFLLQIANAVGAVPAPAHWGLMAWGHETDEQDTEAGAAPTVWTPSAAPAAPAFVHIARAVPCLINCAHAYNQGAVTHFLQVHDLAAAPVAGARPIVRGTPVRAGRASSESFDATRLLVGCVLVDSLAEDTYQIPPAATLDLSCLVRP